MNKTINFHRVTDVRWFENVICLLKSEYALVPAAYPERKSGHPNDGKLCHLTFDDGDISFYNIVMPMLKKHKIPASLFVSPKICREKINYWFQELEAFDQYGVKKIISSVTGIPRSSIMDVRTESVLKILPLSRIREVLRECRKKLPYSPVPFRNINILQLKEIDVSGLVTIGAHTLNHPVLSNESDDQSEFEISNSISQLSDILNHEIKHFAYPNGIPGIDFSQREKKYLEKYGITLSFKNEATARRSDNELSVPRIAISDNESMRLIDLKLLAGGIWDTMKRFDPHGEYRERRKLSLVMVKV